MIVVFDETNAALSAARPLFLQQIVAELCRCIRTGSHFVHITPSTCRWIISMEGLGDFERAIVSRALENAPQAGGLVRSAPIYMRIALNSLTRVERVGREITMNASVLLQANFLHSTQIVVEDPVSDARLYDLILSKLAISLSVPRFNAEYVNGSGTRVRDVFKDKLEAGYITICVVDSDRLSPHAAEPAVKNQLLALLDSVELAVGHVYVTPCHELENLIPLEIVEEMPQSRTNRDFSRIKAAVTAQGETACEDCLWNFFDMKNGLRVGYLRERERSETCVAWQLMKMNIAADRTPETISGFGEALVSTLLDNEQLVRKFKRYVGSSRWFDRFGGALTEMVWYGTGSQPVAIL